MQKFLIFDANLIIFPNIQAFLLKKYKFLRFFFKRLLFVEVK